MYRRVDCTGGPGGPFCNMANMQRLVLPHATAGGGHNMSLLAEAPSGFVAQIEPTSPPGTRRGGVAAQAAQTSSSRFSSATIFASLAMTSSASS